MNEIPENSNGNSGTTELQSLDYLRGVESSTCLLLPTTPSPTALDPIDFKHPLSEEMNEGSFLTLDNPPVISMKNIEASTGDTSSSGDSNSVVHDPVSAQLINNISMLDYQSLSKNGDFILGEVEDCKLNKSLKINNRKLPDFVNWNWPIIRKILLWIVLSGLVACLGAIIAMVVTIPKECNPDLPWYQGKIFYEIYPPSFKDSNNDGTGDLQGIIKKLDYIQDLGVSAIRLNYIFKADNYPFEYHRVSDLEKIDRSLGVIKDFQELVTSVHSRNMFLILDLPVYSLVSPNFLRRNATHALTLSKDTFSEIDQTSSAIAYWAKEQNVDGFYLKYLDNFVDDINFPRTLQIWKEIIGNDKIFIATAKAYKKAKNNSLDVLLSRIDLIDVHLSLTDGINELKNQIDDVVSGTLWDKPYYPWVLWNIDNINTERIATKHINNALALTFLEFVLPGTVSLFYGDEIGIGQLPQHNVEKDFHEHQYIHNLVPMAFYNDGKPEYSMGILAWNSKSPLEPRFYNLEPLKILTSVRLNTPTLYLRSIYKDGNVLKNIEIRKTEDNLIVIERWYPRRNTCVFVANFNTNSITTDLSSMFYGGTVVAGTDSSLVGQVMYFDKVTFPPNSAIVFKLEK